MSNNIQNILDEEFKLLIRATRNELFHFISVQYNHYDLVRKVKKDLTEQYPNRPVHSFNLDNCNPDTFIHDIVACKSGLVFIEKFDLIFTEPFRSLCIGFNQRRDLFSTFPIQIIVFIPAGEEYLQKFQKAMPDVFSIVNPVIQLVMEIEISKPIIIPNRDNNSYDFANIIEAQSEIDRIERRLKTLENIPENAKMIVSLKRNLAKSYHFVGEFLKSKSLLEDLLMELQAKNNLDFEKDISVIEIDLASVLQDLGDYNQAKKVLEKAMVSAVSNFGEEHPNTAISYSNLAAVFLNLGDYKEAKKLLEKATVSAMNNFGETHPTTAVRYSNLATVLQELGDYEGAKKLLEKAMISNETNFGEVHPTTALSYSNLAVLLENLKDYEGAKKLLERALISNETNFGEKHPTTAVSYSNLAAVFQDLGDYEGAKKLLEKAMLSDETTFGEHHPSTARTYSNLATVNFLLKDFKNAVVLLEKAYKIDHYYLGDNHATTKIIKENLDFVKEQMK